MLLNLFVSKQDQGQEVSGNAITGEPNRPKIPVLGLYQTQGTEVGGRIVAYGDSNCIDNSHLTKDCWWMLDAILEFTSVGHMPRIFEDNAGIPIKPAVDLPKRMEGNQLHRYSKVCSSSDMERIKPWRNEVIFPGVRE